MGEDGEFKIEKDVPAPAPRGRNQKYPWNEMQVGDSFYHATSNPFSLQSSASSQGKNGKKFTTRVDEHGIRVWRIA